MVNHEFKQNVLQVENVSRRLGGRPIVRDVNFTIKNVIRPGITTGQVIALLGPSGIGKTRLFEVIAGLARPDTGCVLLGSPGTPVVRGQVGVVFQNYPLFEHRTVMGNMVVAGAQRTRGWFGYLKNRVQIRNKAVRTLEQFGLSERAKFYPAQISGGQRQRAAIAQQLMCSEHFLLMDEPFSGLDPNMIVDVCKIIKDATNADDFNTTIVVTHDVTAAISIADFIYLMGWERDAAGNWREGATIIKVYDLITAGLAWHEDIATMPECAELVREIKTRFKELKR